MPSIPSTGRRRGAVLVLAAVLMVVLFSFVALSVDVGYIALAKAQLENATDAAALAGAAELTSSGNESAARDSAESVAFENLVAQQPLVVDRNTDIEVGHWDAATEVFTPGGGFGPPSNAVRVVGELNTVRGNALQLFFAPVLGHSDTGLSASSIATVKFVQARDIMLVIDCSTSMGSHNRMGMTRAAAAALVAQIDADDRVGMAVYSYQELSGKTGHLENSLAFDVTAVDARVDQLVDGLYTNGTNIAGGMRIAIEEFASHPRLDAYGQPVVQLMVLMTDGHANITESPGVNPHNSIDVYAGFARDAGIVIQGITLGDEADEDAIRDAAHLTGGNYDHVDDGDIVKLMQIYSNIGRDFGAPRLVK